MTSAPALGLPHVHSGKVRDIYAVGDDRLLMVTSDRISAFDVVMDEPIPHKGRVLTAMSAFWFAELSDVVPGHLVSTDARRPAPSAQEVAAEADLAGRMMLTTQGRDAAGRVHRARLHHRLGVEGVPRRPAPCTAARLPAGLLESERLPEPVFTPSTKAELGHDENISFERRRRARGRGPGGQGARPSPSSCTAGVPTGRASGASSSPTPSSSSG